MSRKTFLGIGAGPGIGIATARRFAREGFDLILAARNAGRLEEQAVSLRAEGIQVVTLPVDATNPQAVADLVRQAGPSLSVIHYNAGVLHYDAAGQLQARRLTDESVPSIASDLQINVTSALAAIHAAIPALSARGGTILLTGGGFGVQPSGDFLTLSVGKAALRAAALALFEPLKQQGMHIGTVTVSRVVDPASPHSVEIAEAFWQLHAQQPEKWMVETVYS